MIMPTQSLAYFLKRMKAQRMTTFPDLWKRGNNPRIKPEGIRLDALYFFITVSGEYYLI